MLSKDAAGHYSSGKTTFREHSCDITPHWSISTVHYSIDADPSVKIVRKQDKGVN